MRLSVLSSRILRLNPQRVLRHPFYPYLRRSSAASSSGGGGGGSDSATANCSSEMASASLKPAVAGNPKLLPRELNEVVGIARKCWIKFKKEAAFAIFTPFIVSLASGNLKLETFRHCVAQDAHFLKPFAQAFEVAEDCAEDDDAKIGINELKKVTLNKLKMHDSFAEEWGIDPVKDATLNPATTKCIDFLLATASGKIEGAKASGKLVTPFEKTKLSAYTLGAMTPCMSLYAYIGKELQIFIDGESNHPYKKWIESYSSDSFQAFALQTEELLDKLSVSLTGEELDVIEKLYYQGIKREIDFFLAQPLEQKCVVPLYGEPNDLEKRHLMIFSDFDLTCTTIDSSAILAEIAIVTAPKSDQSQTANQIARMTSADLRNTWGVLSKNYTEDYEQCIESMLVSEKAEKFNYEALRKALEKLSEFEKVENQRVIDSGVLKGLNLEDIKRAGERLMLQDGCINFFQTLLLRKKNLNADVHVLSYCWCGDLIRSTFSSGGLSDQMKVHANEFKYEESLCTGEIVKKMESPIDKVQAFSEILQQSCSGDGDERRKKKRLTVYIGDSVGDLLCLLEADVGIVVGSSSSLRRVGNHFGVKFVPLFPGVVEKQKAYPAEGGGDPWKGLSGVLYTASGWSEIHAFLIGS
ncbi:hypothetical protein DM860_014192 [Cuscuta australis]|uniref:Thiaminase-2/PQQC domain-containing protein n=1 Tax=Cuscuta australis TaxID=267555 RepID=A0A328DHQ8_9ASTE|nr:hypothetical protein DM860_014192 [Cuscuta australis]